MEKVNAYKSWDNQLFLTMAECLDHEKAVGSLKHFSVNIIGMEDKEGCYRPKDFVVAVCERGDAHEEIVRMWLELEENIPPVVELFDEPTKNITITPITQQEYLSSYQKHYLLSRCQIEGYPNKKEVKISCR